MIQLNPRRRRLVRDVARAGTLISAAMFVLGLTSLGRHAADAAASGTLVVKAGAGANPNALLTGGGAATRFRLEPPPGATCSGDTATGGFSVYSFLVPAAVTVESLAWDPVVGPTAANPAVSALYDQGTAFVAVNTTIQDGALTTLGAFEFSGFTADVLVPGDYNLGYACITRTGTLDKYWSVGFTFAANLAWTVQQSNPVTSTTSTTSTTIVGASTTTTVRSGSTTTTVKSSSSTTVAGSSTTTTAASATSTSIRLGSGSGFPTGTGSSGGSSIPITGGSPVMLLVWGLMCIICGRIAILFSRPLRVIPHDAQ